MSPRSADPAAAVERLADARRAFITCHRNPDGDALGSALALAELVGALGGSATVVNRDPIPSNLQMLPGAAGIRLSETLPAGFPDPFDLVVTVECPGLDRAGFQGLDRLPILNIDHHPDNPGYGELNLLDPEAPAVGEMVWSLFDVAGVVPSRSAATNCFVALSTDTGDFRYSNASARAFRAAAAMVERGARPAEVAAWVHESRSEPAVRLLGEALRTLELSTDGRLAVMWVDEAAFGRARAHPADTEDIVNLPRSIAGVEMVLFLKQHEPGTVRVSLRSKPGVDVRSVAAAVGGGGHTNAAGCTVAGELTTVRGQLVELARRALENAS